MSVFSGLSRPMKAAGVALIGIAVVAAVIGGVTALSGNGSNEAGPSGTPTQTSGSPSSPPPSNTTSAPPTSTSGSPTAPSPTSPAPSQPTSPGPGQPGGDQQASNKWVTVRVFNNSLIKDLAERAASDFRGAGWNVNEVGNYSQGIIPTTTAFYRPGTDEEAAAKQLAQEFGIKADVRFPGIENASPGVIVIVTKEYQSGHKGS